MPKNSKDRIAGQHFTWNLFARDGVWYADGRHNPSNAGKHSLGTRDRGRGTPRPERTRPPQGGGAEPRPPPPGPRRAPRGADRRRVGAVPQARRPSGRPRRRGPQDVPAVPRGAGQARRALPGPSPGPLGGGRQAGGPGVRRVAVRRRVRRRHRLPGVHAAQAGGQVADRRGEGVAGVEPGAAPAPAVPPERHVLLHPRAGAGDDGPLPLGPRPELAGRRDRRSGDDRDAGRRAGVPAVVGRRPGGRGDHAGRQPPQRAGQGGRGGADDQGPAVAAGRRARPAG